MTELPMPGLHLGPMGAWLAAVGILRVLHRADPDAQLWWEDLVPVVGTSLGVPEREIADRMVFSPVVTCWQSGGGWGDKDQQPVLRLEMLRQAESPRLRRMRETIVAADSVVSRVAGRDKTTVVRELRNWLPEPALPWLDVAVPLRDDPQVNAVTVGWAPLAGTGGNDGRWDLSTNYHAAILALAPEAATDPAEVATDQKVVHRRGLLADLLEGTQYQPLEQMSGGPYWPQPAGAKPLLNPWAMVLSTEGLLAFGDQLLRVVHDRHQPWTTAVMAAPTLPDEPGRGEVWLPLWAVPMTLPEVQLILAGPWPQWRSRPARRPAEMYAALHHGGFPPGVTGVARFGLARRHGRLHHAVPLDIMAPQLPPPRMLTAAQAAAKAGVAESTWTSYVARDQAPTHDDRDPETGEKRWWEGTVDMYLATRPGRGIRLIQVPVWDSDR